MNCSDGRIDRNGEGSSAKGRERELIYLTNVSAVEK